MKNYYKGLLCLLLTRPLRVPVFYRLKMGTRWLTANRLLSNVNVTPPPITIAIRPTYRCNLSCIQCAQWGVRGYLKGLKTDYADPAREMNTAQWKSFISEVARFRPYIYFTGGEPLLRDDIFELINFTASQNLAVGLSTNGTLLEEKAKKLIEAGLDYLYISLDGPDEVDDAIRVGKDSFNRAMQGILSTISWRKKLRKRLPIVEIRTTITSQNQNRLFAMAEFVDSKIGADAWSVSALEFTTTELAKRTSHIYHSVLGIEQKCWEGFVNDALGIDPARLKTEIENIKNGKWKFKLFLNTPIDTKGFSFEKYFGRPEQIIGDVYFCAAQYAFTQIQPNGDVATCGGIPDYVAGTILKDRFMDIWNGEKYKKIREYTKHKLFPTCSRCRHLYTFKHYGGLDAGKR